MWLGDEQSEGRRLLQKDIAGLGKRLCKLDGDGRNREANRMLMLLSSAKPSGILY